MSFCFSDRVLDLPVLPPGALMINILKMEDKKKETPVINLDEVNLSKETFKFRGRTITDENGKEILHALDYAE